MLIALNNLYIRCTEEVEIVKEVWIWAPEFFMLRVCICKHLQVSSYRHTSCFHIMEFLQELPRTMYSTDTSSP